MTSVYLDYAAATPLDASVLGAMEPYFSTNFYNPSATYTAARDVAHMIDSSRKVVAHYLGARPAEIIFTAGGTEANNLAISGVMALYPAANAVCSAIEHDSVLAACRQYDYTEATVTDKGLVDVDNLEKNIDDRTVLVSIMYANNEIGTVQPLRRISESIKKIRTNRQKRGIELPLYFHTDAAQATNFLDLQVSRLGVDLMTLNGGKVYGPKQSGALYMRSGVRLKPLLYGGGQEQNVRSGTENVPGIVGFAAALKLAQDMRHEEVRRLQELQSYFFRQLEVVIPGVVLNGSTKKRLPNNIHVTIPCIDNERVLIQLDEAGIMAAAGSACSASNEEPSHVLRAIGKSAGEAQSSIRFTMGRGTTKSAIDSVIRALADILA